MACGIQNFSLHSGRRGRATALVMRSADKGLDFAERALQVGGRWAPNSTSARQYVDDLFLLQSNAELLNID